jgi:hypothetical protein
VAIPTLVTGVQFDLLAEEERQNYELVDGELVYVPSATPNHNRIASALNARI